MLHHHGRFVPVENQIAHGGMRSRWHALLLGRFEHEIMKSKDHNRETLALQRRIGELNALLIQRDDQMRELQHQLANALAELKALQRFVLVESGRLQ